MAIKAIGFVLIINRHCAFVHISCNPQVGGVFRDTNRNVKLKASLYPGHLLDSSHARDGQVEPELFSPKEPREPVLTVFVASAHREPNPEIPTAADFAPPAGHSVDLDRHGRRPS